MILLSLLFLSEKSPPLLTFSLNPHRFSDNIESYEKGDDENERTAVLWLGLSGGAHAEILRRLIETNLEQTADYGLDTYSDAARAKIRRACRSPRAEIHFLSGGTQTNRIVISSLLHPYEGVIAADTGHITVHEAGAIECGGHKVLALPHADGKLTARAIESCLRTYHEDANRDHMVRPGMVYLSHPTEYGTLYTMDELEVISAICRASPAPCPSRELLSACGAQCSKEHKNPYTSPWCAVFLRQRFSFYPFSWQGKH